MSDLRARIAAAIYNASDDYTRELMVRPDCPGASELEGDGKPVCYTLADAVIAELGLREERWKSDDPKMLRGHWTRWVTDWTPPADGAAAPACATGCMWQIPRRVEDMTAEQRQLLERSAE